MKLPHTWNAKDGEDGGDNYVRMGCWYRRGLEVTPEMMGKELVLRFEGANREADVYVNGVLAGKHVGGFGAFAFDVTRLGACGWE